MNDEYLTRVELDYHRERRNYRLLFGHPVDVVGKSFRFGVTNQVALFAPGALFGLDLWERNDYGTTRWTFYVLQAAAPGEVVTPVPQVHPGAIVLLEATGITRAKAALSWLVELEKTLDPATLSVVTFSAIDFRLKSMFPARKRRHALG